MTKHPFSLSRTGDLKALFSKATLDLHTAQVRARDLAAQLEAELSLIRLFSSVLVMRPL